MVYQFYPFTVVSDSVNSTMKLSSIICCISCFFLSPLFLSAQTTYIVAGDSTSPGVIHQSASAGSTMLVTYLSPASTQISIDIDMNGLNDLKIIGYNDSAIARHGINLESTLFWFLHTTAGPLKQYKLGDTIFAGGAFPDLLAGLVSYDFGGSGPSPGTKEVYAAMHITAAPTYNEKIAWVRMRLETTYPTFRPEFRLTVLDYAYKEITVGIDESEIFQNLVTLYPNPSNDIIWIHSKLNQTIDWMIFDELGRQFSSTQCNGICEIDISALSPGIYFARGRIAERSVVKKFAVY